MTELKRNDFLNDVGEDWIAVDAHGTIVGRARTEEAARKANPAATIVKGNTIPPAFELPVAPPVAVLDEAPELNEANVEKAILAAAAEAEKTGLKIALNPTVVFDPLDHDGDGRKGGVAPAVGDGVALTSIAHPGSDDEPVDAELNEDALETIELPGEEEQPGKAENALATGDPDDTSNEEPAGETQEAPKPTRRNRTKKPTE